MTGTGGLQRLPVDFIASYPILLPPLDVQQAIVTNIEHERNIIEGNREMILIYEEKIKKVISRVWGE